VLAAGFFSWRTYRWDQPWLRPDSNSDIIAIRFDGVRREDKQFSRLRDAFLLPFARNLPQTPVVYGFHPKDMGTDERTWPTQYSWVRVDGNFESAKTVEAFSSLRIEVDDAMRTLGVTVRWQMALIARDGSVTFSDVANPR